MYITRIFALSTQFIYNPLNISYKCLVLDIIRFCTLHNPLKAAMKTILKDN